jgi:hypothetical protein
MSITGFVTEDQRGNDFYHGEITSLPFGNGNPFSIIIIPRTPTADVPDVHELDCKLLADADVSPLWVGNFLEAGVSPENWSPRNIIHIANTLQNQQFLSSCKFFWAAGQYSPIQN